jgi:hypothetical protein
MKFLLPAAAVIAVGVTQNISMAIAFTSATYSNISRPSSSKIKLQSVDDVRQRIKNAGCGVATIISGDLSCYDPDENGKLQGSGDLQKRLAAGANFPGKTLEVAPSATPGGNEMNTKRAGAAAGGGTSILTNLLNGLRKDEFRPRKSMYGGGSQC